MTDEARNGPQSDYGSDSNTISRKDGGPVAGVQLDVLVELGIGDSGPF